MAPICIECRLAMQPLKNGVIVEEMADFGGYKLWQADSWKCPSCDDRVIVGFGRTPLSEHWMPNWKAEIKANPDRIRFWGTLAEMERYDADDWQPPGYVIDTIVPDAIANAREQAAGVANPVTAGELREAVDKTERAAAGDPFTPQSAVEYAVADRLASEWVAHE